MSDKLKQISILEQNMQMLTQQKQQFQTQLIEVESAMKELDTTTESFKIIGNIMVKTDKQTLVDDISQKKEMLDLRISTLEKQEKSLKEKFKSLQEEVMSEMKEADKNGK